MAPGRWRAPAARTTDPLVVGLVALGVYALHGHRGVLDRDLGVFVYGGEQVAHGVPPYAGIFNSVGPLADAVPGLAIRLGETVGLDPVLSARLFFLVLSACCCALLSVLARDTFDSRAAGLLAPAVFLTFGDFLGLAGNGPREKTLMVLLLLAALVLAGRHRWVLAGAGTALATLTWQPVLAVAVAGVAVLLVTLPGGRRRATAGFVAGGLITLAAAVAAFAAWGALPLAVEGFVLVNLGKSQPSMFGDPAATWHLLSTGYGWSLWLVLAGLVALPVLALRSGPSTPRLRPALGVATVVGIAWTVAVINGAPDLFELLPSAALGVAGTVLVAARHLPGGAARTLLVGATAAAVLAAGTESVTTRADLLGQQRADIAAVLAAAPVGASLLSIDAPEVMALAQRRNPTGLQVFDRSMVRYLRAHRPGGMAGYAQEVARLHPTLIAVGRHAEDAWLLGLLERSYLPVGRGTTWTWYLARSAGPAAELAVVTANRAVMGSRASGRRPSLPPRQDLHGRLVR